MSVLIQKYDEMMAVSGDLGARVFQCMQIIHLMHELPFIAAPHRSPEIKRLFGQLLSLHSSSEEMRELVRKKVILLAKLEDAYAEAKFTTIYKEYVEIALGNIEEEALSNSA